MQTLLVLAMFLVSVMDEITTAQTENPSSPNISDLDCGETLFTNSSGVISLPANSNDFPARVNCTYIISTNVSSRILLSVSSLQMIQLMQSFQDCDIDNITVGCVSSDRETQLNPSTVKTYCRDRVPVESRFDEFYNCSMVKMYIRSSNYNYHGDFRINFTVTAFDDVCGNTSFTGPTGVITSPRFPLPYPHDLDCVYTIDANRTNSVLLNFSFFHLEGYSLAWTDSCEHDSLTISCLSNDSVSTLPSQNRKYCGRRTTPMLLRYSNCDSVILNFVTDSSVTEGGFQIQYTISPAGNSTPDAPDEVCGSTSFTGPAGVIASPQFHSSYSHSRRSRQLYFPSRRLSSSYSPSISCTYSIVVDRMKTVVLRFLSFHGMGSWLDDCEYDGLTISCLSSNSASANPSRIRKYCGEIPPPQVLRLSNCDTLSLHFVSGLSIIRGGFQLLYTITSPGNSTQGILDEDCGYTYFTGPSGVITSPLFPLSYTHSLDCAYTIDVDRTKTVLLYTLSFRLEGTSNHPLPDSCSYDWITATCLSNGSESGNPSQNRKYCGEKQTPLVLRYSNCNSLTLNFITDSSVARAGFEIRYIINPTDQSDCGNTLFSGSNGVISSPNFPLRNPRNLSCTYSIDVGRNNLVALKLLSFDLEKPDTDGYCLHDWLMITCNETTGTNPNYGKKLCGSIQWRSSMLFLDCPSLMLKFSGSSSVTNSTGFMIEYNVTENSGSTNVSSELDCGNTLFANSSGVINLPSNPTNYLATINCTYIISANDTRTILLSNFFGQSTQLLYSFQDCKRDNILVGCASEGETKPNPNTTRMLCSRDISTSYSPVTHLPLYQLSPLIFADCHTLKLTVRSVNYDYRETLPITYLSLGPNEECGNRSFSAPSGIVTSAQLPWMYHKDVNCLYTIDGGHVKSVVLNLVRIHLGSWYMRNGSCDSDWLTITCLVNGTSVAHPLSGKQLCGTMYQIIVRFPGCSVVLLNYSNDHTTPDSGFSVRYRMGDYDEECENTSFTGPSGVITSPRFPLSYPHNLDCMYSIVGGPKTVISLSFHVFQLDGISNTPLLDHCYSDWLIITCLSDESATVNIPNSRKYCGLKTTPLTFSFSNCAVVVLNFLTDSSISHGGFRLHYIVRDTNSLCGVGFHERPSGVINFPWNFTNFGDNFDCNYVFNATEPSSISLTIWSISLQGLVGENCQRDWLQISCVSGQPALNYNVSHSSCDNLTSSRSQITFFSCATVEVVFHKSATATGKTFRIEYTVTEDVEETSQPLPISVSMESPITRGVKCEQGCKISENGTNCDCATTSSGYTDVNTVVSLPGKPGHSVAIAVTVILVVVVAVGLATLFLYRRYRTKHRSEMLLPAKEEEPAHLEFENDNAEAGALFAAPCRQDRDTSKYVPLRPLSHDRESSSSKNSSQFNEDMQPIL